MKFLITGITGFAGPHLANLLHAQGHEICGLIRHSNGRENDIRDIVVDDVYKDITFINSDLVNYRVLQDVFKDNEFDGVFHLAAQMYVVRNTCNNVSSVALGVPVTSVGTWNE